MKLFLGVMGAFLALILFAAPARAGEPSTYCQEGMQGSGKEAAKNLAMCGRILDSIADQLSGQAEKACYWESRTGSPACMQKWADSYNQMYGAGSFEYRHDITSIIYTGMHYKMILDRFAKSDYANEAEFALLLGNLIGHPNVIKPRVKAFLDEHKSGVWHRKGLLLWARLNEDIWYIHKNWSWVLYNEQLSPEELLVRSEPYRQEALKTYQTLMKDRGSYEGDVAASEYAALDAQTPDKNVYSIVNDSFAGPLSKWGIYPPQEQSYEEGKVDQKEKSEEPVKDSGAKKKKRDAKRWD